MYHNTSNKKTLFLGLVLILCLVFVAINAPSLASALTHSKEIFVETKNKVVQESTKQIAKKIGTPMKKDHNGNINILVAWFWWEGYAGAYLTDSLLVASFDPKDYSVAMISVPRDLIVNKDGSIVKINSIFAYAMSASQGDKSKAALSLASKLEDLTGLTIPYYVLVDFQWFLSFLDQLWGIDVDIPYDLYDYAFPGPNDSYRVFSIQAWRQHLDAQTALNYARSRHSTSDFSRSQRQQLIIKAILDTLKQEWLSFDMIENIYTTYTSYLTTNISLEEMLGLLVYGNTIPETISFWYTYECNNNLWKTMKSGCLLYPVNQEDFGGMAGMLPRNAYLGNISHYQDTQNFAQFVTTHQGALNKWFAFNLYNAVDPKHAAQYPYRSWLASGLATKLKRYGFEVASVQDADEILSWTRAYISGEWDATPVLETLKLFFDIDEVQYNHATVNLSGEVLPNTIDLYLGNTFIDRYGSQIFNTYMTDAELNHYREL